MKKIVINARFGGYSLSEDALRWMAERGCEAAWKEIAEYETRKSQPAGLTNPFPDWWFGFLKDVPRDDPLLVQCVEILGRDADGKHSKLKIIGIPEDIAWEIKEYDGNEWVAEKHRIWGKNA